MQSTTQTRLCLPSRDIQTLDAMAALYDGTMKRKLYARIAANGGKAKSHKTAFCREHGISARMCNAIAIDLQGLLDGTRELLDTERKELLKAIRRQQRQLDTRQARLADIDADRLRMRPPREAKLRHTTHRNGLALTRLQARQGQGRASARGQCARHLLWHSQAVRPAASPRTGMMRGWAPSRTAAHIRSSSSARRTRRRVTSCASCANLTTIITSSRCGCRTACVRNASANTSSSAT
ncbi:Exonuclease SbcC [Paraburkholderia caribensis]|nr:Exonuclease SbcC [Paraburkholderia caribensis]